jgi:hypothetical protein
MRGNGSRQGVVLVLEALPKVPVAFFFENAPNASGPCGSHGSALSIAQIDDFVSDSNGLRLIGAFMRIENAHLRRKIVMLVQEIAGDDGN